LTVEPYRYIAGSASRNGSSPGPRGGRTARARGCPPITSARRRVRGHGEDRVSLVQGRNPGSRDADGEEMNTRVIAGLSGETDRAVRCRETYMTLPPPRMHCAGEVVRPAYAKASAGWRNVLVRRSLGEGGSTGGGHSIGPVRRPLPCCAGPPPLRCCSAGEANATRYRGTRHTDIFPQSGNF